MKVLIVASAAGLTALITYLMVVGEPILLPLVIAVFAWYLINALSALLSGSTYSGMSKGEAGPSRRVRGLAARQARVAASAVRGSAQKQEVGHPASPLLTADVQCTNTLTCTDVRCRAKLLNLPTLTSATVDCAARQILRAFRT